MVIINKRNKKHKKYKINKKYEIYKDNEKRKENNKKLIEKYPFLKPPKEYVDFYIDENADYDYSFTMADFFFDGYLNAFGFDLFNDIRNELLKTNDLYNCRLIFIGAGYCFKNRFLKESLLFFEFFNSFHGNKYQLNIILDKYKYMMNSTCPLCGKRRMLLGEKFLCDDCEKRTGFQIFDVDASTNLHFHEMVEYPYDFIVDDKRSKSDNKKLIKNLPFFMPDRKTIDIILGKNKEYDYSFTALDFMPVDFLRRHGIHFIEDINLELMKNNNENKCHFGVNGKDNLTLGCCYIIFDDDFNGGEGAKNKINEILKRYYDKEKEMRRKCRISLIDKFLIFMKM